MPVDKRFSGWIKLVINSVEIPNKVVQRYSYRITHKLTLHDLAVPFSSSIVMVQRINFLSTRSMMLKIRIKLLFIKVYVYLMLFALIPMYSKVRYVYLILFELLPMHSEQVYIYVGLFELILMYSSKDVYIYLAMLALITIYSREECLNEVMYVFVV